VPPELESTPQLG